MWEDTSTHSELPESPDVVSSLKAGGLQVLIQAALDGGQATHTGSNHCHSLGHGTLVGTEQPLWQITSQSK